jgi:hypothetical protein
MISERMIAANRTNGPRSRGPRTAAGKASSRRNALQHGLSVPVVGEPALCGMVEELARALVGAGADRVRLGYARLIAEAEFNLARVQYARVSLLNSCLRKVVSPSSVGSVPPEPSSGETFGYDLARTAGVAQKLTRLDRYEARAISRRRRAMRALQILQLT